MEFGRRLRMMRALRGIDQKELARRTGIPNWVLSNIETSKMLPTPETEAKVRDALHWPARADEAFATLEGDGGAV